MNKKELIFRSGEVALLLSRVNRQEMDLDFGNERNALSSLSAALRTIYRKYGTLSEGYLQVLLRKPIADYDKHLYHINHTLFHEEFDKLPLLLNDPVVGVIANFRLQVGR